MEYEECGVVEVVKDKGKWQSIKFRGREDWFSNWGNKLKLGDSINFNYIVKGNFKNIKEFEYVNPEKNTSTGSPEPSYSKASAVNEKETSEIKSKIKEVTISRGQNKQFKQYEPTTFHVSVKAEFNESDDFEKLCSILTEKVETELNREIINETERQKENGD